jgi:threonine/homoserine/homoserine lactone efflux protein
VINREKLEDYFYLGTFLIAMLFALLAVFKIYISIDELIRVWFTPKYQNIFQALYGVAVLGICVYLIREKLMKR